MLQRRIYFILFEPALTPLVPNIFMPYFMNLGHGITYHIFPIRPLILSHMGAWVHIRERKIYSTANFSHGSLIFISSKRWHDTSHCFFGTVLIGVQLAYGSLADWIVMKIHVQCPQFLVNPQWYLCFFWWTIMVIILWNIDISIVVFIRIMLFFVVSLIILLLILIDVYICGVILVWRVLNHSNNPIL